MIRIEEILKNAYNEFDKDFVFEKVGGKYISITYQEFIRKAIYLADYLLDKGFKDKRIALYAENSINLMISDVAILSYVGVVVNVSKDFRENNLIEIINDLEIACLFYSSLNKDIILSLKDKYPKVEFISLDEDFSKVLEVGKKISEEKDNLFSFPRKDIDCCSKIVFSSGTTSKPKAVELSLKNIFFGYNSLSRRVQFVKEDVNYLYLPLHHTYANIYNFLYAFLSGMSIYLASDIKNISKELIEVNPTLFCSVPYIYETILNNSLDLSNAFGNKIKYLFAGGSSLSIETKKKYLDNNLFIMDAYALSEVASSLAISYRDFVVDESVGVIFEDIDVKIIGENDNNIGEIVVKGDNVFLGYANDLELTKKVFDSEGYFHTGDIGYIRDNKLYFVDRIKPMIITSKGENISTEKISNIIYSLCDLVVDVNLFIVNDLVNCQIFIKEKIDYDWESLLDKVNNELFKYEKIALYEVIVDKRLKK